MNMANAAQTYEKIGLVLGGTTGKASFYQQTLNSTILKSVQYNYIKLGHKTKMILFQPTRNSVCHSNEKKLCRRYDNFQIKASEAYYVNKGQLRDSAQVIVTPMESVSDRYAISILRH